MKTALVLGAGGFIGNHLVTRLKEEKFFVRGVDLKYPEFSATHADEFIIADLRKQDNCADVFDKKFDHIYQLAADMGGAGYIFSGLHDANVMHNSILINANILQLCLKHSPSRVFFASSACVYSKHNQLSSTAPNCSEDSAYPANPDSEYGWEKLFSERLYLAFHKNFGINVRIARFHNIYGPEGVWNGGREKAPAAICRKVACSKSNDSIEIWGDGMQTRSFLYIHDCIDAVRIFVDSEFVGPLNIGSEEIISINNLAKMIINLAKKNNPIVNVPGPVGVLGRNSDNKLIKEKLNWQPKYTLQYGIKELYNWIVSQV
jgi:GDP-D-mannose 3',5'-epimerase